MHCKALVIIALLRREGQLHSAFVEHAAPELEHVPEPLVSTEGIALGVVLGFTLIVKDGWVLGAALGSLGTSLKTSLGVEEGRALGSLLFDTVGGTLGKEDG